MIHSVTTEESQSIHARAEQIPNQSQGKVKPSTTSTLVSVSPEPSHLSKRVANASQPVSHALPGIAPLGQETQKLTSTPTPPPKADLLDAEATPFPPKKKQSFPFMKSWRRQWKKEVTEGSGFRKFLFAFFGVITLPLYGLGDLISFPFWRFAKIQTPDEKYPVDEYVPPPWTLLGGGGVLRLRIRRSGSKRRAIEPTTPWPVPGRPAPDSGSDPR